MKKVNFIITITILICLICCFGQRQEKIEKFFDSGIEIVFNHLKPYYVKGKPQDFILEEEFLIDTDREEISKIGLTKIILFDADEDDNVYALGINRIYKFDKKGNFLKSFNPIEREKGDTAFTPKRLTVSPKNRIQLTEVSSKAEFKIYYFDIGGSLLNIKKMI